MTSSGLKLATIAVAILTVLAIVSLTSHLGVFESSSPEMARAEFEQPPEDVFEDPPPEEPEEIEEVEPLEDAVVALPDVVAPSAPGWEARIEDELSGKLPKGSVAFNAPTEMELGEATTVHAVLSADKTLEELKAQISEVGEKRGQKIELSDYMIATLTSPSEDFTIKPVGLDADGTQRVLPGRDTSWRWYVTPRSEGPGQILHLMVYSLVQDENLGPIPIPQVTMEATIVVAVPFAQRAKEFTSGNWKWLWTTLLVPAWGWVVRAREKSKPAASEAQAA